MQNQRLHPDTKSLMEEAFGEDFDEVHILVTDPESRSMPSPAVTTGNEIRFRSGWYHPNTAWGRRILAHELTHVIQQRSLLSFDQTARTIVNSIDFEKIACEKEAKIVGNIVGAGGRAKVRSKVTASYPLAFDTEFTLQRQVENAAIDAINDQFPEGLNHLPHDQNFNEDHKQFPILPAGHEKITEAAFSEISATDRTIVTEEGVKQLPPEGKKDWPKEIKASLNQGNRQVDIPPDLDKQNFRNTTGDINMITGHLFPKRLEPDDAFKALNKYLEVQKSPDHQADHFMLKLGTTQKQSYDLALNHFILDHIHDASTEQDLGTAAKTFGEALHCIQDSFSGAHTVRVPSERKFEKDTFAMWRVLKLKKYPEEHHPDEHHQGDRVTLPLEGMAKVAKEATVEYLSNVAAILFLGWKVKWTLGEGETPKDLKDEKGKRVLPFFNKWFNPPDEKLTFIKPAKSP